MILFSCIYLASGLKSLKGSDDYYLPIKKNSRDLYIQRHTYAIVVQVSSESFFIIILHIGLFIDDLVFRDTIYRDTIHTFDFPCHNMSLAFEPNPLTLWRNP